ncbi:WD40/YVTN/BNR-like repeat-containing protein [Psychroserpens luteus]|uniref:WD40/YVTN/BNR-like repeat-containing protein n=1 Tax=Psychroserpens luteus TaxID=1434066 RepID=A0ABW5ZUV6_9FLAO|nr:oxidoreductase [Psychroserpens luteus]
MKKIFIILLGPILLVGLGSCGLFRANKFQYKSIVKQSPKLEIEILLQDSTLNVRALELIYETETLVFLTSDGRMGSIRLDAESNSKQLPIESLLDLAIVNDSIPLNFRALSARKKAGFGITIGSPALIYNLDLNEGTLVYQENHPKAFYDSMEFWNDQEGIAIGDPTDNCMSVIITRDGGNTWAKLSCNDLPKAKEGEAAFAASDTNIAIVGDHTWVATGGKASRILYSPDRGRTWEVYETPIVQGLETTGMYSIDFYDEKNGFAIGGDYTKTADSSANKIRTTDGGKTWQLVAQNQSPGYRSCVQYLPNSNAKELIAIGFKGIDYSNDAGESWSHLSDEGFYTIRFLNDSVAYAAGSKRIAKLNFR